MTATSNTFRFLPVLTWLPRYQREWLRYDVIAGLTTWALVVPQAIAYGQLAGLPPQAGLFTAFASLLGYALFATSRHLVVSPTSSTAIISAALVAPLAAGSLTDFYNLSALLAVLVGVVFVIYGLLRLGFVSQFIATAVQAGLMFGLGLTIIVTQLPKILGIPGGEGPFFSQAANVLRHLGQTNPWSLALGAACLAVLLIGKRIAPRFPTALVVVAGSILLVTLLGLADRGVAVIGRIDTQMPRPAIPTADWGDMGLLLLVALMPLFANLAQAVLGAIVISAVIGFVNVPALRRIYHLRRDSFVLSLVALFGVLVLGVLPGLILALLISAALILVHLSRPALTQLGRVPGRDEFVSLERDGDARAIPGLLVARLDAPLIAFNAKHLRRELLEQVQADQPRVVALNMEMSADLDVAGLDTLAELNRELRAQGLEF
jgi:MFS superfamily sulfate permease-like transporter